MKQAGLRPQAVRFRREARLPKVGQVQQPVTTPFASGEPTARLVAPRRNALATSVRTVFVVMSVVTVNVNRVIFLGAKAFARRAVPLKPTILARRMGPFVAEFVTVHLRTAKLVCTRRIRRYAGQERAVVRRRTSLQQHSYVTGQGYVSRPW